MTLQEELICGLDEFMDEYDEIATEIHEFDGVTDFIDQFLQLWEERHG